MAGVEVGEVAASTAGYFDLFAYAVGAFNDENFAPALTRFDGAKQSRRAAADDNDIFPVTQTRTPKD